MILANLIISEMTIIIYLNNVIKKYNKKNSVGIILD